MPAAAPAVRVGPGGGGPHPAQVELQTHYHEVSTITEEALLGPGGWASIDS